MNRYQRLQEQTESLRTQIVHHPVYSVVKSIPSLRIFMEHHVFAVWDFMSLLKRLQHVHTCVDLPWYPVSSPKMSRFINDIVLGEESDEDGRGGYSSHFDLYRAAMTECGASRNKIDRVVEMIRDGQGVTNALSMCQVPDSVRSFVETTWSFVNDEAPHRIAAAFTFGREEVIPDMFRTCVASLAESSGTELGRLRYYLARHIDLDETTHAPMAVALIQEACGKDPVKWEEATEAAVIALEARIALWDGVVEAVEENSARGEERSLASADVRA